MQTDPNPSITVSEAEAALPEAAQAPAPAPAQEVEQTPSAAKPRRKAPARAVAASPQEQRPRILVIGVGGAGGNAVNNMIAHGLEGVEFVCANTDAQALVYSDASELLQLGRQTTCGLGAGGDPDRGELAAEESAEDIADLVTGAQMVFVASGLGGGTGTGAAPVLARIARECGALTVGVVTTPFTFEGPVRMRRAAAGLKRLSEHVDAQIVIPNQNLYRVISEDASFVEAFEQADEVLHQGVRSVTDLMVRPGHVNLDFADVRAIMQDMGPAIMGAGEASGESRALKAAEEAINNPLFDDVSVRGARSVLVNIASDGGMSLREIDAAITRVRAEAEEEALVAFGLSIDPTLEDRIRVAVVATGVETAAAERAPSPPRRGAARPEPLRAAPTPQHHASAAPAPLTAAPAAPQPVAPAPEPIAPAPAASAPVASAPIARAAAAVDAPLETAPAAQPVPRAPHVAPVAAPSAPPSAPAEDAASRSPLHHVSAGPRGAGQPLGHARLAARRPASETPAPAQTSEPQRPTGALFAEAQSADASAAGAQQSESLRAGGRRGVERDETRVDPMRVDIPDFLRRQASQ